MRNFPIYTQLDAMDCGPTCLRMVAKYYGKNYNLDTLRQLTHITREGVSLLGISDAAEAIGFHTMGVKISFEDLQTNAPLPCIVHWKQMHFVVVYKIKKNTVYVADPYNGKLKFTKEEFIQNWASTKENSIDTGTCLLLEPTPDFYAQIDEKTNKTSFKFLFSYLKNYRKLIIQLVLSAIVASVIQLLFPFLTQSIIDVGINTQDISFIYLILLALLVLNIARASVDFIRGWLLLHIGTRINISLISDFLIKMMKLPIAFFDSKMIGDLIQRIQDHDRIEIFLTSTTLNILFSIFNLLIFGIVLAIYDISILMVFLFGSALYIGWIFVFMKRRRALDAKRFMQMSDNQSSLIQLIQGMQEIKLNNCEKQKRWAWERIQAKLFNVNIKTLALSQFQTAGGLLINETKNIVITVIAANAVIQGEMTLGMLLAIQFIIGQINSPLDQLIGFFHATQDAKISLERLGEIHNKDEEEDSNKLKEIPPKHDFYLEHVSFQYEGPHSPYVLQDISITIPEKKVTAIVGSSGSGKTTLIKLLLQFYNPVKGTLKVHNTPLHNISNKYWRSKCGVVMQDGYVFSDTIANNVAAAGDTTIDKARMLYAVQMANIKDFIEELPLGYNTMIGADGINLSQGQKQRLLIARAVYKNPDYIFLDEATNALDANNERIIIENMQQFYKNKTVVIVAHRLSTVKNADQILVLDKGFLVENGTHKELSAKKGVYYKLVKNQLELGG